VPSVGTTQDGSELDFVLDFGCGLGLGLGCGLGLDAVEALPS
jgi:hypothetical protein